MTTEPPERHWYQFRLRTLLLLSLVVSVICTAIAAKIKQNRQQLFAVCDILKMGGEVTDGEFFYDPSSEVDWESHLRAGWLDDLGLVAPAPKRIIFDGITGQTQISNISPAELAATIRKIPSVREVHLVCLPVTMEWTEELQEQLPNCEIEIFVGRPMIASP